MIEMIPEGNIGSDWINAGELSNWQLLSSAVTSSSFPGSHFSGNMFDFRRSGFSSRFRSLNPAEFFESPLSLIWVGIARSIVNTVKAQGSNCNFSVTVETEEKR